MSSEHIVLRIEPERDFLPPGSQNERCCTRLILQTSDAFAARLPTSDCSILLLLDTSQSMNEPFSAQHPQITKRKGVQHAVESMCKELQPNDRVSIVFFDTKAYEIADSLQGNQKKEILAAVAKMDSFSGSTNFEAAFEAAKRWDTQQAPGKTRRIVFLTDGHSTNSSPTPALQMADELAQKAVVLDCLGVGEHFALDAMKALAQPSGGSAFLLSTPTEAAKVFSEILQNAQRALVHDVLLRFRFPKDRRDIQIYQLTPQISFFHLQPDATGWTQHSIRVGDLYHHQTAQFLIHLLLDIPSNETIHDLFHCRLDYSVPLEGLHKASHEEIAKFHIARPGREEIRDTSIYEQYIEASLLRDEADFRRLSQTDWQAASKILAKMAEKARRASLPDKEILYKSFQDTLRQHHKLTQDQLNKLFAKTSKSTKARLRPEREHPRPLQLK